jgi:hypothetical protein
MGNHLLIAGHGKRRNGTFDPGATGHISKGEHRYVSEDLFPAMRKFVPKNHNIVFFDKYNVYDHGNIVALANQYDADEVTEVHFDAASAAASGGHVIVYDGYAPDAMDLALRDAIEDMVGIRYNHRGHRGVNGRSNLANVNRTANAGVTYRLIELGFGTNTNDAKVMTEDVEAYAKRLVEAITGTSNSKTPSKQKSSSSSSKSISQMADEVIAGRHGSGHTNRRNSLGISQSEYEKVRAEVNRRAGVSSSNSSSGSSKSVSQMAQEVIDGKHGNGHANRRRSLGISQSQYDKVRAEVNRRASGGGGTSGKTISQMAAEVIRGDHGSGHANRRRSLGISQSRYEQVRAEVNRRL